MKSVPVAVKPPGRRRTGFRCFWVAERKVLLPVCALSGRARTRATRRDGGHRERGRRGHGQAPGPAAARAHGTRRGAGRLHRGGQRTSARAQPSSPAVGARPAGGRAGGEPRGEAGVRAAAGPALPPPPLRGAVLSAGWMSGRLGRRRGQMKGIGAAGGGGPPRPPQPPSRLWPRAVQTPPRFLPLPPRPPTPFLPPPGTRRASVRSSDLGVAGGEWAARSPRDGAGFPSGQRLGHPLWARWAPGWGGSRSPAWPRGSAEGPERRASALLPGRGRPSARRAPASLSGRSSALAPGPGGEFFHSAVSLSLEKGGWGWGEPFSGGRGGSLLRVGSPEEGR